MEGKNCLSPQMNLRGGRSILSAPAFRHWTYDMSEIQCYCVIPLLLLLQVLCVHDKLYLQLK